MTGATSDGNPVLECFLALACGGREQLVLEIHPADNMYAFLLREQLQHRTGAAVSYFRSGWSAARTILALRDQWAAPGAAATPLRILDFAGGYGRSTRFLVREHPAAHVTACDILADAVEFQKRTFGVTGALSTVDPEALTLDGQFDLIFVGSLFSHLPERSFGRWLRRLGGLLTPTGLLAFTTHDQSLMLPGREMSPSGLYFESMSDLGERLDLADYGSAWVTPAFVERTIDQELGAAVRRRRIPRGAWSYQDLWLIAPAAPQQLEQLVVPLEPQVFLEEVRRLSDRALLVGGWIVDLAQAEVLPRVVVLLDGRAVGETRPVFARPDVARLVGIEESRAVRFELEIALDVDLEDRQVVAVVGITEAGVSYVGHCDTLASSQLFCQNRRAQWLLEQCQHDLARRTADLQRELAVKAGLEAQAEDLRFVLSCREYELAVERHRTEELETRVRAMQATPFWRARQLWFAVKRALRLTDEPG